MNLTRLCALASVQQLVNLVCEPNLEHSIPHLARVANWLRDVGIEAWRTVLSCMRRSLLAEMTSASTPYSADLIPRLMVSIKALA